MAVVNLVPSQEAQRFVEIGATGLKHWSGVLDEEFLRELRGTSGVKTFREMARNDPIIGASLLAYTTLAREATFRIDSARAGDPQADGIAEFVRGALFDDMSQSWRDLLGEIFSFLIYGWSYFEVVFKRREGATNDPATRSRFADQRIGWRKWAIRGQETLRRWEFDETGGIRAMVQQLTSPTYREVSIPITKSLLFRTLVERNSPEGVSILRTAYVPYYLKRRIQIVRGIGIERDLAGLPVLTPPQGLDIWNTNDAKAVTLKATAEKIVRNIRRDEHEGIIKPFGWTLELLASAGGRQFDITAVIAQLNAEIAISMMTDFMLVGHEKAGARSMREDARDTFSHAASGFLDGICDVINRFAIPTLVSLNGWPVALSPSLAHGPVAEIGLTDLANFLTATSNAGLLFPDEGLERYLRQRAQLPPALAGEPPVAPRPIPDEPSMTKGEDAGLARIESILERLEATLRAAPPPVFSPAAPAITTHVHVPSIEPHVTVQPTVVPPDVYVEAPPAPSVQVEAPAIHVPAAVVEAPAPIVVPAPSVHVEAPLPPQVDVHVAAPAVTVEAPPAPQVDVHVAPPPPIVVPAPAVVVQAPTEKATPPPKPKAKAKRVERDEKGRITRIIEEES